MQMGKCLSGQMSFWANVFWANVFLGQCLSGQTSYGQMSYGQMFYGQMSYGQMSFWANVFLGKRLMGKCLMGKCHSRQMNLGQMSHGKRRMGKCCITLFSVTLCLGTRGLHTSQCLGRLAREKTPKESCSAMVCMSNGKKPARHRNITSSSSVSCWRPVRKEHLRCALLATTHLSHYTSLSNLIASVRERRNTALSLM
jgi:hypothetical protein